MCSGCDMWKGGGVVFDCRKEEHFVGWASVLDVLIGCLMRKGGDFL